MLSKGSFYGVAVVLVALLLATSSLSLVYYEQASQKSSDAQQYALELQTALGRYRALQGSYANSTAELRATILLLSDAMANMNTSAPAYANASRDLSSLWKNYLSLAAQGEPPPLVFRVNLLVDFGNGTRLWSNGTAVEPGWDAFVATVALLGGKVGSVWYPPGYFGGGPGEHYVTGIDGVGSTKSTAWFFWTAHGGSWSLSAAGADELEVVNGTTIAWTLCGYDSGFNPTCHP